MRRTVTATFDGESLRPDEPVDLEPNTKLRVTIEAIKSPAEKTLSLLDTVPKVNAKAVTRDKFVTLDKKTLSAKRSKEVHDALVQRISLAPSRVWAEDYFDLVKELIDFCGLTPDDPRLALTMPEKKNRLPVNINQRYVLNAAFERGGDAQVGFILGGDFARYHRLKRARTFNPHRGERIREVPYWGWGKDGEGPKEVLTGEFKKEWTSAVLAELSRGKSSGFRKFHERLIYEAAADLDYRAALLDEAFP